MKKLSGLNHPRVGELIQTLGLSVKEVAAAVRVSEGLVYDWINGTRKFQPRYAQVLSLLYNVSELWLLEGVGEMFGTEGPRVPQTASGLSARGILASQAASTENTSLRGKLEEAVRERDAWRDQARALLDLVSQLNPAAGRANLADPAEEAAPEQMLDARALTPEEMTLIRAWRGVSDDGLRHALLGTIRGEAQADALVRAQTDTPHRRESQSGGKGK